MRATRSGRSGLRRLVVVAFVLVGAGALAGTLVAYFSGAAAPGSAGGAAATVVDPGTAPTSVAAGAGRSVTITWTDVTLANGHPVDGYLVTRYEAAPPYAPQITLGGCSGVIAALTCTESGVPFGSWQYTITPVIGDHWHGLESTKSGAVTIGDASLSLSPPTLGLAAFGGGSSDVVQLTGSLTGFASDEAIAFRLDDPSTGTTLGGSPAHADGGGDASVSVTLPRPPDGPHSIFAVGDAAYPSQASAAVLVDTVAPTSSAAGTDTAWHSTAVDVGLSAADAGSGSGVGSIAYEVDGGTVQTLPGGGGTVTVGAPSNGSNDGTHTITFRAADNAGNVEAPAQSATVKIDATPPSTSLATTPASPDGLNGWFRLANVQFSLSGSDARSGVEHTSYSIDGGATQTYTGPVAISTQGDHTVTYWSVDNAGNTEATHTAHVKLDDVEPSTTIAVSPSSPDGSSSWYATTPSFTLTGSDATSGVATTRYELDGGAPQTYSGAVSIPDGQHTVTYWSTDAAGNDEDEHVSATIKVDTVKPATSISVSPSTPDGTNGWRVSPTTFTLAGSDASSGIASTFYKIDSGVTQAYSGTPVSIPQGSHAVSYWSVDNSGNTEVPSTTAAIKVDTVTPSTAITTVPVVPDGSNNWFQRASVTITLAASDATSGVANSFYTVDGGSAQTYGGTVTISTQGDHTVTYWSVDNAGNTEAASTTHVKLDNVKPTTTLTTNPTSPDGSNNWFVQSSVTFTLAGSDASSGVASTFYAVDAGATQTYAGPVTISTQGDHTVTYWSMDAAGNVEATNTAHVKLDNVKPTTTLTTNPASPDGSNGWFQRASVTFTLAASDATSGVANSFYTVDGGSAQTYGGTVTISTQGDHTVTYWSVDNAGNTEAANTTHVKLDNVAPSSSLSLLSQTGGESLLSGNTVYYRGSTAGSFKVRNAVSDGTSGAGSSAFAALGGTTTGWTHTTPDVQTTPSGGPYVSNAFSWTNGASSTPTEVVTGADAAGNTAAAPTLTFTNDSTAPSTTDDTASIGGACKNTNQTVTLTPSDAASGVAATYYTTDGSTPTTSSSQGTSIALSSDGTYTIKYFSVDKVGNTETVKTAGTSICIDKTSPAPSDVALANSGTAGQANAGDTLTITFAEVIDATTFCSTWSNSGTQTINTNNAVVVQIADSGSNDTLTITSVGSNCGGSGNFHVGSIALGGDYVSATRTFSGSGSSRSQLQWAPGTRTVKITLGAASGSVSIGVAAGTPTYTPSSSLTDPAGNAINTSAFSPSGTSRF
jgi:Chitobiase/beta-hexosaminidase C-terminal domain